MRSVPASRLERTNIAAPTAKKLREEWKSFACVATTIVAATSRKKKRPLSKLRLYNTLPDTADLFMSNFML
jgi:hypothetical protein